MANPHGASGVTGKLFMLVGIAAIAVLLWWLSRIAEPSAPTVADLPEEEVVEDTVTATIVDAGDFSSRQRGYVGQYVNMGDVNVAQIMSPQIVWVELPDGMPFLIKLTPEAEATRPEVGARIRVIGTVLEKTDSVLDAWEQSGAILDAGQRTQSEFGTVFIEARQIRAVGGI